MKTFFVSTDVKKTIRIIDESITRGTITGVCIDMYTIKHPDGGSCMVLSYEKRQYRTGGKRRSFVVIVDDFESKTRVHIGSNCGRRPLRPVKRLTGNFPLAVYNGLHKYIID